MFSSELRMEFILSGYSFMFLLEILILFHRINLIFNLIREDVLPYADAHEI